MSWYKQKWTYDKFEEMVAWSMSIWTATCRRRPVRAHCMADSVLACSIRQRVVGSVNADGELTLQIEGEKNLNLLTIHHALRRRDSD